MKPSVEKPVKQGRCWGFAAILASFGSGLAAQEASFCAQLDLALAAVDPDAQAAIVETMFHGNGAKPANCGVSLDLSGSRSTNCHWAFAFRSEAVELAFDKMLAQLSACADPAFGVQKDLPVNHPDFFDLRVMRMTGGEVGLSLKDKTALQQSFIFLRLTPQV